MVVQVDRTCGRFIQRNAVAAQLGADGAVFHLKTAGAGQYAVGAVAACAADQASVVQCDRTHAVVEGVHRQFSPGTAHQYIASGQRVIGTVSQLAGAHGGQAGEGVLLIERDCASRGFVQRDVVTRQNDIDRAVLHLKAARADHGAGAHASQCAAILQRHRAHCVVVVSTQIKDGCGAVNGQKAAVSQETGGTFTQCAAIDGGASGVRIGVVEDQNAVVGGIAH